MSSVIVFHGSARKNGVSNQLVDRVAAGAESAGADLVFYNLNDPRIRGCQGCMYCRSHEGCATQDALQPFYGQIKDAAGIVIGFPIYNMNISGQTKQWLDRMYPLIDDRFQARYPGKRCVAAYAYGNADPNIYDDPIAANNRLLRLYGFERIELLVAHCTAAPGYAIPDDVMEKAFDAGRRIAEAH